MEISHLRHLGFSEININDSFFDSLKKDYDKFEEWFEKKKIDHEDAYVQYDENHQLQGFLYLKMEGSNIINDVVPPIESEKILKIGTFKIIPHGTKMGEQFLKIIFDYAIDKNAEVVYVTIFDKHKSLIDLLQKYGFKEWGTKGTGERQEKVYCKNMSLATGDFWIDYPMITPNGHRKYLLSIYPKYHSRLFPESILTNESRNIIKDISYTNSIQKNYVCSMQGVENLQKGDIIVLYRTAESGRSAEYSAVATTVCTVTDIRLQDSFSDFDDFFLYTNRFTVFDKGDLAYWYNRGGLKVISMVYNFPLRNRIVRHELINQIGLPRDIYWGFFELSDEKFMDIVNYGQANEYIKQN